MALVLLMLNAPLYRFFLRKRGLLFVLLVTPLALVLFLLQRSRLFRSDSFATLSITLGRPDKIPALDQPSITTPCRNDDRSDADESSTPPLS